LFNTVLGNLTGGAGASESHQGLLGPVLEMLGNQQGGISGLAQSFEQNGLGHIVSSWIGSGENLPISPEQIQQVLGSEQVQTLAQKAGISPDAASSQLASLLPSIVDKLTPGGEVLKGDLMSGGIGLVEGLLSSLKAKA
jgi:uncharacterized protein YidB (DUF937 family)